MQQTPLVSAIIIFWNGERYLQEAIDSVLSQTYDAWELLLVDDGSTDGSTRIAKLMAAAHPTKVRYLEHEGHANRGMSASRNLGIRHAKGEFVALLDADDVWLPEKLARQVPILESRPDVGLLYGPTQYWHSWTGAAEDQQRDDTPDLGVPLDTQFAPPELMTLVYPLGPAPAPCLCSLLIRRDLLQRVGGFEESFVGFYEDQAFLTKVYLSESVYVSSGCWDRYRIHPESCSATVERSGQYEEFRTAFLTWLGRYLTSRNVTDAHIVKALDEARRGDRSPSGGQYKWFLRLANGNNARLVFPDQDSVRIEISKTVTEAAYDTQLNLPGLPVESATRYRVTFNARADGARTMGVGCAKGHSPWTNLGLYATVDLTSEWQTHHAEFAASETEADARLHFDLGNSLISVDLAAVVLTNLQDGRRVEPPRTVEKAPGQAAPVPTEPAVPFNEVDFGSFRRLTPISQDFGCDRGRPIDRYYIENFLGARSDDIHGRVLEVGDSAYTRLFGGERVTVSDVLHVTEGDPEATIIADLASADHIPSDLFDCVILTQTLQLIFDVPAALRTIRRILKPGGVLLATFPGISQSYDHEWAQTWYWNFTAVSARRLFTEAFGNEHVTLEAFGNVLSAVSFLHGLAVEELSPAELNYRDSGYDVTIAVRAVKPPADGARIGPDGVRTTSTAGRTPQGGRQAAATRGTKGIVLMHHRVAEEGSDPFALAVTPRHFAEQLDVLRRRTQTARLQDLLPALAGGASTPASAVTFDDGYADNLLNAKPLLEEHGVPATVFVTTGYVGGRAEFWWDELDRVLLQPGTLSRQLRLHVGGKEHEWDLGDAADYTETRWRRDRNWKVSEPPPSARQATFLLVWKLLQFVPDRERRRVLEDLQRWAGLESVARPTHRQLLADEVVELASGGLIEVGAHTVTHPVLASLPTTTQREEIQQSKSRLEAILGGRPVVSFSYPFGSSPDYTNDTVAIVKEAGFTMACSTLPRHVQAQADPFRLPRIQVEDWDGREFARRLETWLDG